MADESKANELITIHCPCGHFYSIGAFIEHAQGCKIVSGPAGIWKYVTDQFHFRLAQATTQQKGD